MKDLKILRKVENTLTKASLLFESNKNISAVSLIQHAIPLVFDDKREQFELLVAANEIKESYDYDLICSWFDFLLYEIRKSLYGEELIA